MYDLARNGLETARKDNYVRINDAYMRIFILKYFCNERRQLIKLTLNYAIHKINDFSVLC